ncbi:hypothetical protein V2J09_012389 [Rumex salicifolius]
MEGSILEFVGLELIGVMSPVSICMLLVVLLVYSLSSSSSTAGTTTIVTAANLVYNESPSDSTSQKLEGALLNAAVFVILIAAVTFLLVVLYYYNFTGFLKHYMRLSAFFILATMGGSIFLSLISHFSLPFDAITCFISLFNFTVVGVISVFAGAGVPIVLTQTYTVVLGIVTAAWFTQLPEWTTWTLLVALALYDLVAVLAPGGPLKLLVELSQSRDDDLPALVYEARPTVSHGGSGSGGRRSNNLGFVVGGVSDNGSVELQAISSPSSNSNQIQSEVEDNRLREEDLAAETSPLVPNSRDRERERLESEIAIVEEDSSPSVEMLGIGGDDPDEIATNRGIKLGLGDFVFYSVLVGRAALYDLMTVYACYLAIICGLGCTLILLSVYRRALPALPISIALGILFYFLTRLLMEPFVKDIHNKIEKLEEIEGIERNKTRRKP